MNRRQYLELLPLLSLFSSPRWGSGMTTNGGVGNLTLVSDYGDPQAAVDAAAETGAWVLVDGKFRFTPPLVLHPGVSLFGSAAANYTYPEQVGSVLISDSPAETLITVPGIASSVPSGQLITGIHLWGGNRCKNTVTIEESAHAVRIVGNRITRGDYGLDIRGGPVFVGGGNLFSGQHKQSIRFSHPLVRGVTIRDNWFEGGTRGHIKTDVGNPFHGMISIVNNRFDYNQVDGMNEGLKLYIDDSTAPEFRLLIADNHFMDFEHNVKGVFIGSGRYDHVSGTVIIRDNTFDGTPAGNRALHVTDSVEPFLSVHGNLAHGFNYGGFDTDASSDTLIAYGNATV